MKKSFSGSEHVIIENKYKAVVKQTKNIVYFLIIWKRLFFHTSRLHKQTNKKRYMKEFPTWRWFLCESLQTLTTNKLIMYIWLSQPFSGYKHIFSGCIIAPQLFKLVQTYITNSKISFSLFLAQCQEQVRFRSSSVIIFFYTQNIFWRKLLTWSRNYSLPNNVHVLLQDDKHPVCEEHFILLQGIWFSFNACCLKS